MEIPVLPMVSVCQNLCVTVTITHVIVLVGPFIMGLPVFPVS